MHDERIESPFKVGEKYFIRTVTNYATGRVTAIMGNFLVLEDAAWIADTGRFTNALESGQCDEIEPFPGQLILGLGAVVDATEWPHELPRAQK